MRTRPSSTAGRRWRTTVRLLTAEVDVAESDRLPLAAPGDKPVRGVGMEPVAGVGVGDIRDALPATPGIPEPPVPEKPFSIVLDIPGRGVLIAPCRVEAAFPVVPELPADCAVPMLVMANINPV